MSDSEDDELLALAGVGPDSDNESVGAERSAGHAGSDNEGGDGGDDDDDEYEPEISTGRRGVKRQIDDEDDYEPAGSAGGSSSVDDVDPYPLEGRFKDEEDRAKLLSMPEVERESILYDRQQEKEKLRERRYLALRARQSRAESSAMETAGSESKRLKKSKLSELKKQRQRKSRKDHGDEYESEEEEEDDYDDERDLEELAGLGDDDEYDEDDYGRRKGGRSSAVSAWGEDKYSSPEFLKEATLEDLNKKVRASRTVLDRYLYREEFDEVIPGTYIRVSLGAGKDGRPFYRIARVEEVNRNGKPYTLNGKPCNTYLTASQGGSKKMLNIACLSDSPFTADELAHYRRRLEDGNEELPTLGDVQRKFDELRAMSTRKLTNEDINRLVARKKQISMGLLDSTSRVKQLGNLREELQAAVERADVEKVKELQQKISELTEMKAKITASNKMSTINLRNRENTEKEVQRAELKAKLIKKEAESLSEAAAKMVADPNNPFSRLVMNAPLQEKPKTTEETVQSTYRRDGLEAAIKDIPFELELKL